MRCQRYLSPIPLGNMSAELTGAEGGLELAGGKLQSPPAHWEIFATVRQATIPTEGGCL